MPSPRPSDTPLPAGEGVGGRDLHTKTPGWGAEGLQRSAYGCYFIRWMRFEEGRSLFRAWLSQSPVCVTLSGATLAPGASTGESPFTVVETLRFTHIVPMFFGGGVTYPGISLLLLSSDNEKTILFRAWLSHCPNFLVIASYSGQNLQVFSPIRLNTPQTINIVNRL